MTDGALDPTILGELVELDPVEGIKLVRDLIQIFFTEAPARLDQMRCGLSLGDPLQVSRGAHAMRGAAGGLGAIGLADACGRVERQARTGTLTGLSEEIDAIEAELPDLARQVEALAVELGETAGR